jgi:hypothetical protein
MILYFIPWNVKNQTEFRILTKKSQITALIKYKKYIYFLKDLKLAFTSEMCKILPATFSSVHQQEFPAYMQK